MNLYHLILSDAQRYNPHKGIFYTYIFKREYRYVFWLRCVHYFKSRTLTKYTITPPIYLFLKHLEYKYGIHMNTNIPIGPGLMVVHGGSVYVNVTEIGEHFTVYQDVTLGADKNRLTPKVKNNVRIYPGAKIFGNIILNDNSIIAANAVVTKSVDQDTTVMGVPAQPKIKK